MASLSSSGNPASRTRPHAPAVTLWPLSYIVIVIVFSAVLTGCGGGSSSGRLSRATIRERAIASARLTRGVFAVAGIGRTITRSADPIRPRLQIVVAAIRHTRDTPPDFDPDTGLFFVVTTNIDGSGQQSLFEDASHRIPAGAFVWQAPVWTNNQKDTYPAAIHTDYQINSGQFAGERGTIDFVAADATGANGTMHIVMTTRENERIVADFEITNGHIRAKGKCSYPDGTTYDEVDESQPDGGMTSTIDYPDGTTEIISMTPDGSSTEVITGPDGTMDGSGALNVDGMDNLTFDDGSQENVDVDTADAGDGGGSGDTSGGDSSDDSSKAIRNQTVQPRRR
jgi:hypothetical protein